MRTVLADADATARLGAAIAPLLAPGETVLLYGPLGMGKSTLARGLIRALTRSDEDVPSPTFTLVQFYYSDPPVSHFDLYRLTRPEEAVEIGLDEALDEGCAVIEWPERLGDDPAQWLGPDRLSIILTEDGAGRVATVSGAGAWETKLRTFMSDREQQRLAFLGRAGLADAVRVPLPGDASTRRYERLTAPDGRTLMLMDQAPSAESPPADPAWSPERRKAEGWNAVARLSAGRVEAFAAVAAHLRALGLSAPDVVAVDAAAGLAVLEDFGDDLYARVIERGEPEAPLYLAAVEALVRLHDAETPNRLTGTAGDWPLQTYDETALQGGADLFVEWMPKLDPALVFDDEAIAGWRDAWAPVVDRGASGASVLAHRDYHAENLIRLVDRSGPEAVGMIDFQDAVLAHPSWDLHSLLQDARRDVPPALETRALEHYFTLRPQVDRAEFLRDYAGLAALNESRILGVFARLIVRDGKPRYSAFMPRVWRHLNANLARPGLEPVRDWFDAHVPEASRR